MFDHWNAPAPSTEVQSWTRPPMETIRLDAVVATPWLRSMLPPIRGCAANPPVRPVPERQVAWGTFRRLVWTYVLSMDSHPSRHYVWAACRSDDPVMRKMGAALLGVQAPAADRDTSLCLARKVFYGGRETYGQRRAAAESRLIEDAMTDYLVATHGLHEAISIILELSYKSTDLNRLRELMAQLDEASFLKAAQHVVDARDAAIATGTNSSPEGISQAASYLVPAGAGADTIAQSLWDRAFRPLKKFGNGLSSIVSASVGFDAFGEVVAANAGAYHAGSSWCRGQENPLAFVLVAHGRACIDRLLRARGRGGDWWMLIAHIDDPRAFDALEAAADDGAGVPEARAAAAALHEGFRARGHTAGAVPTAGPRTQEPEAATPPSYVPLEATTPMERPEGAPAIEFVPEEDETLEMTEVFSRPLRSLEEDWLERAERWSIPLSVPAMVGQPEASVERAFAIGFESGVYRPRFWGSIASLGLRVVDHFVSPSQLETGDHLETVLPIGDVRIYPLAAKLFSAKQHKATAALWFERHPTHAIWAALRAADDTASRVLNFLAARGHRDRVLSMAADAGFDGIDAFLARDPLTPKLRKKTKIPPWVTGLAPLESADGTASEEEVQEVLLQFAVSDELQPHPALSAAPWSQASRLAFVWSLFDRWLEEGAPAKQQWCLQALGYWGDDETAHKLAAMARRWPGEKAAKRAQWALDTLCNIGSLAALVEIHRLAETSRFPAFKGAAKQRIRSIARRRGLTADQLADRLAPTMDLEEAGDVLDYGPRQFALRFDKAGLPCLLDAKGKRLKSPPKPGAADDAEMAKAAVQRFKTLKKTAKAAAQLHLLRLENILVLQRSISAASFEENFQRHPWLTHLCQRLVWRDEGGRTFRIDESMALVDVEDESIALSEEATVTLAHPLDTALDSWVGVFDDYAILQPFEQFSRPVVEPTPEECVNKSSARFKGKTVKTTALLGLRKRGWHAAWGMSHVEELACGLGSGLSASMTFSPGWYAGDPTGEEEDHTLDSITFSAAMGPVQVAEILSMIDGL